MRFAPLGCNLDTTIKRQLDDEYYVKICKLITKKKRFDKRPTYQFADGNTTDKKITLYVGNITKSLNIQDTVQYTV